MTTFPTLYKKTSTGADQSWEIATDGATIVTCWGQIGGAIQVSRDVVKEGKNLGKKNATTPAEQAALEAQAQWEKKLKRGYVKTLDDAQAGKRDAVILGGLDPMLAHRFDQHGHKIVYPCYVQPKLDGHRCIAVVTGGKCTLWSRNRKPITSMPHIVNAIEDLKMADCVLDGELYNHAYKSRFEELTSFIRDTTAKPGSEVVQFHVYDMAIAGAFQQRTWALKYIANDFSKGPLVFVATMTVDDEESLLLAFERFLAEGYEGAIARNAAGLYANKRSSDLLKIKEFMDDEFLVTGVEEGRGKLAGHAIFVCKAANGNEFRAKMMGKIDDLKGYFQHPERAIGKQLTVKYFGLTNKSEVPRFPVAMRFREGT